MTNSHPLKVMGHASETELQVGENLKILYYILLYVVPNRIWPWVFYYIYYCAHYFLV